jgi:UDPglucose 6-dehydrogenase
MREAPSGIIIGALLKAGATVHAFDPVAMEAARRDFPPKWFEGGRLAFLDEQYAVTEGADALILVTEWKQFRNPDFDRLRKTLKSPVIFDGRNQFEPRAVRDAGFEYFGVGR